MLPLLVTLTLSAATPWDGRSPVQVPVGASVSLEVPARVRFVSVGGGDVVDVTVSRDLRRIELRGLRRELAPSPRTSPMAEGSRSSWQ